MPVNITLNEGFEGSFTSLVNVGVVVLSLIAILIIVVLSLLVCICVPLTALILKKMASKPNVKGAAVATTKTEKPKIAILKLHGVVTLEADTYGFQNQSLSFGKVKESIDEMFLIPNLERVVLSINSPGGVVVQTNRISSYIKEMAVKHNVSVVAFIEDFGASGGYLLACSASEIYADKSSVVGSIGVIIKGFGFHKLMNKWGIERRIIAAGENKAMMDPFSPTDDEDVHRVQNMVDKMHKYFIDLVKVSRGDKLRGDEAILFSGQVWTGAEAVKLGLLDGVDHMETYLQRFANDYEIVEVEKKPTLMDHISKIIPFSMMSWSPIKTNDYNYLNFV